MSHRDNLITTITHNQISTVGYVALVKLDEEFLGTPDYMGIAWFWNHAYRHHGPRDCTTAKRRELHRKLLAAGLELDGESSKHQKIVEEVFSDIYHGPYWWSGKVKKKDVVTLGKA